MKKTYTLVVIVSLFMVFISARVWAMADPSLYRAQLPIINAENQPSSDELKMALTQVLSKLTNIHGIDKDPSWADSLNRAKDWMLSYQYTTPSSGGQLFLQVDFDPVAITQLLKSKGQSIFSIGIPERLIIWLAVDNGKGQQLFSNGSQSVYAKTIDAQAEQKSISVQWPLLDLTDLKILNFNQVWAGDWPAINTASKRYNHDGILLVHLNKGQGAAALWASEWTLKTRECSVDWAFSSNDAESTLRGGMAQLSAVLGKSAKTSVPAVPQKPLAPLSEVQIIVYGVGDLSAMDALKSSLQQLTLVQDIEVVELSPDEVILKISCQGDKQALQEAIASQITKLIQSPGTDENSDTLTYQWAL